MSKKLIPMWVSKSPGNRYYLPGLLRKWYILAKGQKTGGQKTI